MASFQCKRPFLPLRQRAAGGGGLPPKPAWELIGAVNIHDFVQHLEAILGRIVQSPQKWADEVGSRFRHQKRLRSGKNQCDVDADALAVEHVEARTPAGVIGTFTTMLECQPASSRPSRSIPCVSVDTTSAFTTPSFTISQAARISSRNGPPSLAAS